MFSQQHRISLLPTSAITPIPKSACKPDQMFYDLNLGWQDPNALTHRERLSMACKLNIDAFALTQEVADNLSDRDRYIYDHG